jgi:hypothetical protein
MEEFEIFGGNVDQYATITIACCVLHNYGLLQSYHGYIYWFTSWVIVCSR